MALALVPLPHRYAVCRLAANAALPEWATGDFVSVTRTPAELSVVADERVVPPEVRAERGWRFLAVQGPLAFEMVGVLAGLSSCLANANISVFVISTFDTDYIAVKQPDLPAAIVALRDSGYDVQPATLEG